MSLQFILGNSGSGKTEYLYHHLVREAEDNPLKNYLVIVPEQFTLQTQRKLVDLSTNQAIMNIDVLSFKRLAFRVFDDMGIQTLDVLEEIGKNLVLRKVAQEQEDHLTVLRPNMNRMGYIGEVKSLLSELMQYNVSCEELKQHIQGGDYPAVLEAKLKDVATMYDAFTGFLKEHYITEEEILGLLKKVAKDSVLLRGSVIALDEFTGFTPIQNLLLSDFMQISERIMVALTIDGREDFYHSRGDYDLFNLPKQTIHTLMGLAREKEVEVLEPVVQKDAAKRRFKKAKSLSFMEQNLFRRTYQKSREKTDEIVISSLKNPKEELIYVAREINRLVREEGIRYRQIAVVTGSVGQYGEHVEDVFEKYNIPFFMDQTKGILFHPFIEFIRAALEVIRRDFSYEAVFRFLRCGFCGIEEKKLDLLDNYLIAAGICGYRMWSRRFLRVPKRNPMMELEQIEELRVHIMQILEPLRSVFMDRKATVEQQIRGLYEMIVGLDVEEQLRRKEKEYLQQGQQARSLEYGQIYQIVMQLLDKYVGILGQETMQIDEFVEVLDAGLEAADVAVLPPGYDSVTVGDIERTRLNDIRILFFVGVNDGIVPKTDGKGGIISQYERELLKRNELVLAPGAREQTFIQKYYLYLNMTKPSERLYLSFARVDSDGKGIRPSYLVGVICRMFPALEIHEIEKMDRLADYSSRESMMDYLINGERDAQWYALARYFMESDRKQDRQAMERLLEANYYRYLDEPISEVIAEHLYGRHMEASVTRLENFASCAYAHFLQYGLMLREREESGFASIDMGNLYHAALERYSLKLEEDDWFHISEEKQMQLAANAIDEVIAEYPDLGIYATAENRHMADRMKHIFQQTIWALTTQVRKGRFVPKQFEVSFHEPDVHDALSFSLGERKKITLTGRIDRCDTCEENGQVYVKVIDYKSGNTRFDLLKVYQGTQLQLMVYMNAAMAMNKKKSGREVVPGGVLYYHIDDPVVEAEGNLSEEEAREAILECLRPDGLVNREEEVFRAMDEELEGKSSVIPVKLKKSGEIWESASSVATTEEFAVIQDYVGMKIKQTGEEILKGNISVNPYMDGRTDSCHYCPYASVCSMDTRIPGFGFRQWKPLKKEEILEKMETAIALR